MTQKNRRDLYYFLSKKYFFRSRAAFKLIELNQKFGFLSNSRGILDLCAAPGGWLQVARKIAPKSSLIIGIDAKKIIPIKGCNIIKADITSPGCLGPICQLKKWRNKKIDVVLHDGAPRMGTAWIRDALNQNDLTLSAFKLALGCTEKRGWFISKIFCSGNFHGLLFLFDIFFEKIQICKPKASRKTSAETYVICKNFLKPLKFDKNLLDSRFIFGNIDSNIQKKKIMSLSKKIFLEKKNFSFLNVLRKKKGKVFDKNFQINLNEEILCLLGLTFFGKIIFSKNIPGRRANNFSFQSFLIFFNFWYKYFEIKD